MTLGWIKDVADLIRDVRLSVFLCISCIILLFLPYKEIDLEKPKIVTENIDVITIIGVLSFANVMLHFLQFLWRQAYCIVFKIRRRKQIKKVFQDLNFQELCVLYYCTQAGIKAFKAPNNSVIIMSLKEKGCIRHISGLQSVIEMHFRIFDDIYDIVREHGKNRFPKDFLDRYNWDEEVRDIFLAATDWRRW